MINKWKKLLSAGLAMAMSASLMAGSALAVEYSFAGDAPGQTFYQSTSTDLNNIAENGQIVVGTDGTVSAGVSGNVTNSPLSTIDLPVGEYPEAYGFETSVDVAGNSVFPNELGPTTQNNNVYTPTFIPTVDSGAIPTPNTGDGYVPTTSYVATGYTTSYGVSVPTYYSYSPLSCVTTAASTYYTATPAYGVATSTTAMPTITSGGAIGRLSIPSVGINKYVYEGTSTASMRKGVAHFECTSGWLGNIALAGHNRGSYAAFGTLKNVKLGDVCTYTTAYGTLTYVVTNVTTCPTTDTSGLAQDGVNRLTMYTCVADQPNIKLCVVATMI